MMQQNHTNGRLTDRERTPARLIVLRVLFTLFAAGTVVFIFSNSMQSGAASGLRSAAVTEWLNGGLARVGVGWRFSERLVRKLGHFSEYALLGFWLMLSLRVYTRRILSHISWPLFFGLLAGVVSVGMIITQGATYLQMRTVGELHLRTRATAQVAALVTLVCFALAGVWVMYGIDGYVVKSTMDHYAASNPLNKEVVREAGAWLVNFNNTPILWAIPALGVVLPLLTILTARMDKAAWAFVFSSLTLACIILTAGIAMFPFVMPSSTMMNASLTMWDATSSQLTLNVMTWVAVVLVPIILLYTAWCYWKMFGRITKEDIERNTHSLY